MKGKKKIEWIEAGYELTAKHGFDSLNVEFLARSQKKSKSSFYHYFGDMEMFERELLDHHINQTELFTTKISSCESMRPDVLNVFVDHKTDLLFHKYLRVNRSNPRFKSCFEKAFQKTEEAVMSNWMDFLQLNGQEFLARTFFDLIAENFLLQITEETFDYDWISNYMDGIHSVLQRIQGS